MLQDISKEFIFKTSRSGGKGGQHVNKVETQVEVRLSITNSVILTDEQKSILINKLAHKLTAQQELIVVCNEDRTQLGNKAKAVKKILDIIQKNLAPTKTRVKTKIPKKAHAKRLQHKTIRSQLKQMRRLKIDDQ